MITEKDFRTHYRAMAKVTERRKRDFDRYATVVIAGHKYYMGVERGRRVRIPFKPRGQNIGYEWNGFVRDETGRTLWSGGVDKGVGAITLVVGALSFEAYKTMKDYRDGRELPSADVIIAARDYAQCIYDRRTIEICERAWETHQRIKG